MLAGIVVSKPDADHTGSFLDVFDAYEVQAVYLSGDPKGTSIFNVFFVVRDKGSRVEGVRAGYQTD